MLQSFISLPPVPLVVASAWHYPQCSAWAAAQATQQLKVLHAAASCGSAAESHDDHQREAEADTNGAWSISV